MLPVEQADNVQFGVERSRNDDIARLRVGMANAKICEVGIPGDERLCDEAKAVQVLNMIRRRLLLIPVSFPPHALERQQRLAEVLQIS